MFGDEAFVDDDAEELGIEPELNRISRAVIGCAIGVHKELGPGQLESVYQKAMAIEMRFRGVPFEEQKDVVLHYRGVEVGHGRMDFVVEGKVIVDLKAVEIIVPTFRVQMISYLKMTKLRLGLIINFNVPRLVEGVRRIAN